jgi:hypothetical protein
MSTRPRERHQVRFLAIMMNALLAFWTIGVSGDPIGIAGEQNPVAQADRTIPRPVNPSDRTIPRLVGSRDITLHLTPSALNTHPK